MMALHSGSTDSGSDRNAWDKGELVPQGASAMQRFPGGRSVSTAISASEGVVIEKQMTPVPQGVRTPESADSRDGKAAS